MFGEEAGDLAVVAVAAVAGYLLCPGGGLGWGNLQGGVGILAGAHPDKDFQAWLLDEFEDLGEGFRHMVWVGWAEP